MSKRKTCNKNLGSQKDCKSQLKTKNKEKEKAKSKRRISV